MHDKTTKPATFASQERMSFMCLRIEIKFSWKNIMPGGSPYKCSSLIRQRNETVKIKDGNKPYS